MMDPKHSPVGEAATGFILDLFRLNSRLLAAGDALVAGLGLTSARWQVLTAIDAADRPQPVAWLARDMGARRQNIQRIVNDLEAAGFVAFAPNQHHRRAHLVVLTDKGREVIAAAFRLQVPWVEDLAKGLDLEDIATARDVMSVLRGRLEGDGDGKEGA